MDILESKHLKGLSSGDRLELSTRALCQAAERAVATAQQLEAIAMSFEKLLRSMAKILIEEDRSRWEKAISKALERRDGST